ncbi:unnamed protein product [Lymnaea stagnalis]|uniref:Glycosyl hydrolase family 13 catalytic domain-containing protein n=1 Tax=Lymnaea stagnalis TaxID=6523 RepID=A0AAV2H452_LYMST
MTDPADLHDEEDSEKTKFDLSDDQNKTTTTVNLDPDESSARLIINGGSGKGDYDDTKTKIVDGTASSDGEVSFNGLGKDEVLKYANDPFWVRLRWILFILFWVGWIAMLVTAITIIVLAPRCPPRPDLKWYNTEIVYQVAPQSFKDSDGDGYGDFKGLTEKMSYITDNLGAKAIWLNSIYKNDGRDGGLGIIDHKDIDPKFGVSLDDFKDWLKKMRKEGKKIILDLIPNQTSKNHTWFLESKKGVQKYKDYYVWSNKTDAPNWESYYGEPAWKKDTERNEWYLHQFGADHPDLNLQNEDVREEIKGIMKFWFDAGVSGFHIQGLEYLVEDADLRDEDDQKLMSRNNRGSLEFLEELRVVADQYSDKPGRERLLFGSVLMANKNQTLEYWGTAEKKRLHIVVPVMEKLKEPCNAACAKTLIDELIDNNTQQWLGLQLSNEYVTRVASRMDSSGELYKSRLMVAHALQLLLPGTVFNYYGDEFGQRESIPDGSINMNGRETHVSPMQWNTQENAGFTDGPKPWNNVGPNYKEDNVQVAEAHNANTPLDEFISLSKLRTKESFQWGKTKVVSPNDELLLFTRRATRFSYFLTIINFSNNKTYVAPHNLEEMGVKAEGKVVYHSKDMKLDEKISFQDKGLQLNPYNIVVVEYASDE